MLSDIQRLSISATRRAAAARNFHPITVLITNTLLKLDGNLNIPFSTKPMAMARTDEAVKHPSQEAPGHGSHEQPKPRNEKGRSLKLWQITCKAICLE